jgi:hypothetical protein
VRKRKHEGQCRRAIHLHTPHYKTPKYPDHTAPFSIQTHQIFHIFLSYTLTPTCFTNQNNVASTWYKRDDDNNTGTLGRFQDNVTQDGGSKEYILVWSGCIGCFGVWILPHYCSVFTVFLLLLLLLLLAPVFYIFAVFID